MRTQALAFVLIIAATTTGDAQTPSAELQRLNTLLGTWDVEDVYQPPGRPEYRERGTRTCSLVLLNRYVECVTKGRNQAGRDREYRWLINYNSESRRYEMVSLFSNVGVKEIASFHIDSAGSTWNIRRPNFVGEDGIERAPWAQLIFSGRDRAVWTGYHNLATQSHLEWIPVSRETWTRRAP